MANLRPIPKGHRCPPLTASHPSGRWESAFVYSFICKYTNLRAKVEGLETPMDFEEALLSREPNDILTQVLARFILNLRPQTRNLSIDHISTTVATVLEEYLKTNERTIYWDDDKNVNISPFHGLEGGFFTADWDFKLKILRQLVELQLCHNQDIKNMIDRAWGVSHTKHKKKDETSAPPPSTDPNSREQLQFIPLGQDSQKRRFWAPDDSPRLYVSTNPWKMAATFTSIASTREEYLAVIEDLKASSPPELKKGEKRSKNDAAHLSLVTLLESRIEAIDAELIRVEKARKKIENRNAAIIRAAQTEIRETRTRRQTRKPDYVYSNPDFDDDEDDEYTYQEADADDELDDDFLNFRDDSEGPSTRRAAPSNGYRRSTRTAVLNANGKRDAVQEDSWAAWRGERRSARLGAPVETQFDAEPPTKRARTEESTMSTGSADAASTTSHGAKNGLKLKASGAAALKPTEIALEQIAGKKRSKFWVYAVEPVAGAEPESEPPSDLANGDGDVSMGETNGRESDDMEVDSPSPRSGHASLDGPLSPLNSP